MTVNLVNFLDTPVELQLQTRNWRNSDSVAPYFKIKYIDEDTHRKWLNSLKDVNPKNVAFIIMNNNEYIGVTYFHSIDYEFQKCDWGIYIHKTDLQGLGIGNIVLQECLKYAKNTLKMTMIYLDVLKENTRAIKLYEKFGFKRIDSEDSNFLRYLNKL